MTTPRPATPRPPDPRAPDPRAPDPGAPNPRALHITHLVTNEEFAGTERYVVDVSARLAQLGHVVTVIGGRPSSMRQFIGERVHWREGSTAKAALRALAHVGHQDIVHSHIAKSDFLALMAAPRTRGVRISTRHIVAPRGYTAAARRLAPLVRRALTCEVAVSSWTSSLLERPSDVVLLNGVRAEPDVDTAREPVVLLAQRLAPEKDTAVALEAWARTELAEQGWRLDIAGSGVERPRLENLARSLGVADSVHFRGWLADPTSAYRHASIFLAPAPTEPCGLSVLEAMAHGLPVVAAGSAGHLETVGQCPNAALFPAGDATAAASHLVRLAVDATARTSYAETLRTLQRERFTIDEHVDRLVDIYRASAAAP